MTVPRLPAVADAASFGAIARDDAVLDSGVDEICRRHGLEDRPRRRYARGSLPVFAVGDLHALKLFPPHEAAACEAERRALDAVAGRIGVPTPGVDACGELDGWHYLLMQQLRGEPLVDAWPRIPLADRTQMMHELGVALARLHALPTAELAGIGPAWIPFLAGQRANCVERQRGSGLAATWLEQIPEFLGSTPLSPGPRHVLLHTEVMREHLIVEPGPGGWELSGLVDFEPAMVGEAEYELASIGVFVTAGEPGLLGHLLAGYGRALDAALQRRALAYALLHRYSRLSWYLERVPPRADVTTLASLAEQWWGG
jgi:hygromycin-B 7''-O-kinase